jgi:TPR repeat protein
LERCSRIGRLAALLVALPLTFAASARAGQFEDATAAYERGDYATAFEKILPLAEAGDARAQFNLCVLYHEGRGVPQNYAEAAKWFRLAASQGDAKAQFSLGALYAEGQGVPQNYAEAAKWFRLAASQGYAPAQGSLGALYYLGHGVPQNYAEAYFWFDLAAARLPPGPVQQDAEKIRDEVATLLRPEDLAQAQQRASAWQPTAQTPQ